MHRTQLYRTEEPQAVPYRGVPRVVGGPKYIASLVPVMAEPVQRQGQYNGVLRLIINLASFRLKVAKSQKTVNIP